MIESPLLPERRGFIGGRWVGSDSGRSLPVVNPANGERLAEVAAMGTAETERAVDAAAGAFDALADLGERRRHLEAIDRALHAHQDEIGRILTSEHGKPIHEARVEVAYAAGFYRYCAENLEQLRPHTLKEQPKGCTWTVHYRPAGVAGLISPWNFPIAMIAKKLSAAIAGGCPSVVKPSSKTPLTMIALFTLLEREVGLPPGVANLVIGSAGPIAEVLCRRPEVRVISFTGSTGVGQRLMRDTADGLKRLALELGGNAPFIVFADADLDAAADQLLGNKFRGGGQTCVCANRILVEEPAVEAFTEKLRERVARMKVGDGLREDTDLGPLIDRAGFDKVRRHVQDALEKGAERVFGDDPKEPEGEDWGCFHPPTVVRGVTPEMACYREETFGPLVPIAAFRGEDEAVAMGNDTEFGLASYVFTGDRERAERVAARLRFGHCGINTGTGPTPEAPFGGMKLSGFGREGGAEGLFEYVEPQTLPHGP